MASHEYALVVHGDIDNVVTGTREGAERIAAWMEGDVIVVPLDSLPLDVKRRYRFWNERP